MKFYDCVTLELFPSSFYRIKFRNKVKLSEHCWQNVILFTTSRFLFSVLIKNFRSFNSIHQFRTIRYAHVNLNCRQNTEFIYQYIDWAMVGDDGEITKQKRYWHFNRYKNIYTIQYPQRTLNYIFCFHSHRQILYHLIWTNSTTKIHYLEINTLTLFDINCLHTFRAVFIGLASIRIVWS